MGYYIAYYAGAGYYGEPYQCVYHIAKCRHYHGPNYISDHRIQLLYAGANLRLILFAGQPDPDPDIPGTNV